MNNERPDWDFPTPTHEELVNAVARAHRLRAQAMRNGIKALGRGLRRVLGQRRAAPIAVVEGGKRSSSAAARTSSHEGGTHAPKAA